MNRKPWVTALGVAVLAALPAFAHHSFAMFDRTKEVTLKDATVKEWQWTSPHVWLFVVVPNGTANPDKYTIEGGNPGALRRFGYSKGTFQPNDKVTVYISPLKSGEKGGAMLAVALPSGKMLGERLATNNSNY
jgi:Family of unknown function (DUF6152)